MKELRGFEKRATCGLIQYHKTARDEQPDVKNYHSDRPDSHLRTFGCVRIGQRAPTPPRHFRSSLSRTHISTNHSYGPHRCPLPLLFHAVLPISYQKAATHYPSHLPSLPHSALTSYYLPSPSQSRTIPSITSLTRTPLLASHHHYSTPNEPLLLAPPSLPHPPPFSPPAGSPAPTRPR